MRRAAIKDQEDFAFGANHEAFQKLDEHIRVSVENPSFTDKKTVRGYFTYSGAR